MILKLPHTSAERLFLAHVLRFYEREIGFYDNVAASTPLVRADPREFRGSLRSGVEHAVDLEPGACGTCSLNGPRRRASGPRPLPLRR